MFYVLFMPRDSYRRMLTDFFSWISAESDLVEKNAFPQLPVSIKIEIYTQFIL